jgi:hypothetical protein
VLENFSVFAYFDENFLINDRIRSCHLRVKRRIWIRESISLRFCIHVEIILQFLRLLHLQTFT